MFDPNPNITVFLLTHTLDVCEMGIRTFFDPSKKYYYSIEKVTDVLYYTQYVENTSRYRYSTTCQLDWALEWCVLDWTNRHLTPDPSKFDIEQEERDAKRLTTQNRFVSNNFDFIEED